MAGIDLVDLIVFKIVNGLGHPVVDLKQMKATDDTTNPLVASDVLAYSMMLQMPLWEQPVIM